MLGLGLRSESLEEQSVLSAKPSLQPPWCAYVCVPCVRMHTKELDGVVLPLTLIRSLLSLLQLLQSCGQTLLSTIQLLLNQLDASVQRSYVSFSLGRE